MRHIQITAFVIRLIGLALIIYLLREHLDVGLYGDGLGSTDQGTEPSFRFAGIYLLHASRTFWVARVLLELLGSLVLFVAPHPFASRLWSGISLGSSDRPRG